MVLLTGGFKDVSASEDNRDFPSHDACIARLSSSRGFLMQIVIGRVSLHANCGGDRRVLHPPETISATELKVASYIASLVYAFGELAPPYLVC